VKAPETPIVAEIRFTGLRRIALRSRRRPDCPRIGGDRIDSSMLAKMSGLSRGWDGSNRFKRNNAFG